MRRGGISEEKRYDMIKTCGYLHICIAPKADIHIYIYIINTYIYIRIYIYTYMCMYIYTYIHVYIYIIYICFYYSSGRSVGSVPRG